MTGAPHREQSGPLSLTGLVRRHSHVCETYAIVRAIGRQWTDYMTCRVAPPWNPEAFRYGIAARMRDGDTEFTYFCGAPPPEPPETLPGFSAMTVPALSWAVFPFFGHITEFRDFIHAVFARELPLMGFKPALDDIGVPEYIERYDWRYDPVAGKGGFDLMIPIEG